MNGHGESIKVTFLQGPSPPPRRLGPVGEAHFNRARDAIVAACARHGTVGPSGAFGARTPAVAADPDFYVVDDYYGDDRRILVEPETSALSVAWLEDLASALREVPGWDVLVMPGESVSLLVRDDNIECTGWASQASDLTEVIDELRRYIDRQMVARAQIRRSREEQVSQILPVAWRLAEGKPLAFVAAFQTLSDGTPSDSVWMLHFEDRSVFDLDKYAFDPDALRPSLYWAERSGHIAPYTPGSHASKGGGALLAEWALVEAGRPIIGAKTLRLSKGGETWSFDLHPH